MIQCLRGALSAASDTSIRSNINWVEANSTVRQRSVAMTAFLRSKDDAEMLVWSDGRFESIEHAEQKKELCVVFTDYCSKRWRLSFSDVDGVTVDDPVYCTGSSHETAGGRKQLVLFDDDGVVLSFRYAAVHRDEETA